MGLLSRIWVVVRRFFGGGNDGRKMAGKAQPTPQAGGVGQDVLESPNWGVGEKLSELTQANEGGGSNDYASENASLDESNKVPIVDNELAQKDQSELLGECVGNGESKIGIADGEISDPSASSEFGGISLNKGGQKIRECNPPQTGGVGQDVLVSPNWGGEEKLSESTKANEEGGSNDLAGENASLDGSASIADNGLAQSERLDNDQSELSEGCVRNGESKISITDGETSDSDASSKIGGSASNKGGQKSQKRERPIITSGKRSSSGGTRVPNSDGRDPASAPRLVCFDDRTQGWTVAVKCSGDIADVSVLSSDCCPLSANRDGLWVVDPMLEGEIRVKWGGKEINLSLTPPLIFRTRQNWKGRGMRQRGMTNGYYIVFAPREWKRKREEWNPVECRYDGFRVHEFEVLKDKDDVGDGFEEDDVFPFRSRFQIEGNLSFDDERGAIFMGAPPHIIDLQNWKGVDWIVAGVEGAGKCGQGPKIFPPQQGDNLPEIWKSSKGGWFFARIYSGGHLIHNPDIRFLRALRDICVETSVLPLTGGHGDMIVNIAGEGVEVKPRQSQGRVKIEGQKAIIKPRPGGGNVIVSLCADGAEIDAEFADPRVWWALVKSGDSPKWTDKPLKISREEFDDVKTELRFKLPEGGIVKSVEAGISPFVDPLRVSVTRHQSEAVIPLRSLGNPRDESVICARFADVEGGREIPVLRIVADHPPPLPLSRRRRISGVVVGKARGIVQVRVKHKRGRAGGGCRKIQARDRYDRCQKGDRVVVEKLPRHPKAWRVVY